MSGTPDGGRGDSAHAPPAEPPHRTDEPGESAGTTQGVTGWLLAGAAALFAIVLAVRAATARLVSGPMFFSDDMGYLLNARHLAGVGEPIVNVLTPFYYGGYSLLIAPAFLVTDAPYDAFATVQAINALVGATLVVPLYLLARHPFGAGRVTAGVLATAATLYTGVTVQAGIAWAENLAPVLVAWTLVGVGRLGTASRRPGVVVGLAAGALSATHPRFLPLIAVLAIAMAVAAIRRRLAPRTLLAAAAPAAVLAVGGLLLNRRLRTQIYTEAGLEPFSASGIVLDGILRPETFSTMLTALAGQVWHLGVASAGVGAVALLALWHRARGGSGEDAPARSARAFSVTVLVWWALLAGLSAALASGLATDALRADHMVYGRYTDPLVPVLILVGLLTLPEWRVLLRRPAAGVVGLALLLSAVVLLAGPQSSVVSERFVNPASVPGILAAGPFGVADGFGIAIIPVTAWALMLGLLVMIVAVRRPAAGGALIGAWFIVASITTADRAIDPFAREQVLRVTLPVALAAQETPAGAVAYDLGAHSPFGLGPYQFRTPARRFLVYDSGLGEPPPVPLVVSSAERPPTGGADRLLARERLRDHALWITAR